MGYPKSEFPEYALYLFHEFCEQAELPFEQVLSVVEKFYRTRVIRSPQREKHLRTETGISWYKGNLQVNELLWLVQDGGFVGIEEVTARLIQGTMVILVTSDAVFVGRHLVSTKSDSHNHYRIVQLTHEQFFVEWLPEPTGMTVFQALEAAPQFQEKIEGSVDDMINAMLKMSIA